uniref:tRNA-intron lyase n=1 Tax=Oryza meridionalis TaxID=40149 RepID=A0A0E0DXG7_9ORYZ
MFGPSIGFPLAATLLPSGKQINRRRRRRRRTRGGVAAPAVVHSILCEWVQHMDLSGPRWKKGKDGQDFSALAAANPMSAIFAELKASFISSKPVAVLSGPGGGAILGVEPEQAVILNRAAFGHAVEIAAAQKHWFQLSPEEVFYLCHVLNCIRVESQDKKQMSDKQLWDHFRSMSESFPEMYKAYSHLRPKNWVVRSGLQYGADFVSYRQHPALIHSEFAVVVVPEGISFGDRCGHLEVWSDLLRALRAFGSVAKTLLLAVHERTITRWIPPQCCEERSEASRDEANREELISKKESVEFNLWGVILGFSVLSSLLESRESKPSKDSKQQKPPKVLIESKAIELERRYEGSEGFKRTKEGTEKLEDTEKRKKDSEEQDELKQKSNKSVAFEPEKELKIEIISISIAS